MKEKQKCFISYNKNDCDLDIIKSMINYLKNYSNNTIDFLIDEDLRIGKDINAFMNLIREVEAVIVLLTPEYKRKADERIDSGVYTEYKIILERLEKDQNYKQNNSEYLDSYTTFCFIPIIFTRNYTDSCPKNLYEYGRKALDFTNLQFINKKLLKSIEAHYKKQFKEICSEISAIRSINSKIVKEYEQELHKSLFIETKHDNIMNKSISYQKELYVKTHSFNDLKTQIAYLFLGRKGCGKSTLGHLLFLFEREKYKEHIEVNVNQINLEYTLNIIFNTALQNDLDIVIKTPDFFKLVWEVLLLYKCCEVLYDEFKEGRLSDNQKNNITSVKIFLDNIKNNTDGKSFFIQFRDEQKEKNNNPIFQWSISSVVRCIEQAIKTSNSKEEIFHYELHTLLKRDNVLLDIFSEPVLNSIYSIISECKRKLFISFDGFDDSFEKFRKSTNNNAFDEKNKMFRKKIEVGFLEGFLNLAMDIKSNRKNDVIYNNMDMCVIVPKDRFFEIKGLQRDSYRYISVFQEIKWTGIELTIMLRKRLELLYEKIYLSKKEDFPRDRLISVMKNLPVLNLLPSTTTISINYNSYKIDTFLNILRHTFCRPREILIYYARLIAIAKDFKKRKRHFDGFAVSKIISETTFDIIKEEFISEFENYCLNIKDILNMFKLSKQILSRIELEKKLETKKFIFIDEETEDFYKKFEFLFEIGFIGIEVPKPQIDRYKLLNCDIFSFNTDNRTFEILKSEGFENCNFIIHPIFCEFLGLDLSTQNRPILNLSWDYLERQDSFMLN
jgi:energy-coupling factor transporter ATP-binding protein EcfA2